MRVIWACWHNNTTYNPALHGGERRLRTLQPEQISAWRLTWKTQHRGDGGAAPGPGRAYELYGPLRQPGAVNRGAGGPVEHVGLHRFQVAPHCGRRVAVPEDALDVEQGYLTGRLSPKAAASPL